MSASKNDKLVSPLAKARGLGSAHEGVHHWMHERITAAMLVPLVLWLVYSMITLQGANYMQLVGWMHNPINATLLVVLIITAYYHAALGAQVIVEDYVGNHTLRLLKIIAIKIVFGIMAIASIFSILRLAL